MDSSEKENEDNGKKLRKLDHDIRNELSNIILVVEQLRYEVTDPGNDYLFYLDIIKSSCTNISVLLNSI